MRFPNASKLYTPRLRQVARDCAQKLGPHPAGGRLLLLLRSPVRDPGGRSGAARILGGDAVGMSTAPEVIVAGHCGMEVLGFTLLSNMAAGILDQPLSEEEVLIAGEHAREDFSALVRACLREM